MVSVLKGNQNGKPGRSARGGPRVRNLGREGWIEAKKMADQFGVIKKTRDRYPRLSDCSMWYPR